MTNVDGMRILSILMLSCHLSLPPLPEVKILHRTTHITHSLARSIVRLQIMRRYYQQFHLFPPFFSGDNECDAIQLAHCSPHLRTKLLLGACARYARAAMERRYVGGALLLPLAGKKYR